MITFPYSKKRTREFTTILKVNNAKIQCSQKIQFKIPKILWYEEVLNWSRMLLKIQQVNISRQFHTLSSRWTVKNLNKWQHFFKSASFKNNSIPYGVKVSHFYTWINKKQTVQADRVYRGRQKSWSNPLPQHNIKFQQRKTEKWKKETWQISSHRWCYIHVQSERICGRNTNTSY